MLYRDACRQKRAWDAELTQELVKRWQKWEMKLPVKTEVPRALVPAREPIQAIALHAFGGACAQGVAAAVYAVVDGHKRILQIWGVAVDQFPKRMCCGRKDQIG